MACRENNKKYRVEETSSPLVSGVLESCWAREEPRESRRASQENQEAHKDRSVRAPAGLRVMRLSPRVPVSRG